MKSFFRSIIVSLAFLISLCTFHFALFTYSSAQSTDELARELQQKQEEIAKLESQLNDARGQEKTLKSQLDIIDGQTKVTQLKIEETNLRIEKLQREITDLSGRITRISGSVDTLSEILLDRIVKTYKYGGINTFDLIFSSNGLSQTIERLKYIQVAQANDKKVLYQLQATKQNYNDQKQDKQNRQTEAERLNNQLGDYKKQLESQKTQKQELLRVTQNDETRFQGVIAQLRADAESISRAISNVGLKIGPVTKGQVIAAEGLTGCTSGPHLHFEVYENAKIENSQVVDKNTGATVQSNIWNYLRNPRDYIDTGKLGPPMQGYPGSTHVSTEFGELYALGKHTGLDIYDDAYVGTPILAADNGVAYAISGGGCSVPGFNHGNAKGIIIDHGNGLVTLYWHLL